MGCTSEFGEDILKILIDKHAVSEVLGYALTLALAAVVVLSATYMVNTTIEDKKVEAAEITAKVLSNRVANAVTNVWKIKQQYPNANYSIKLNIPTKLSGFEYYIELTNNAIFVNTTNGRVKFKRPLYNEISERLSGDLTGKVYGSQGVLNVSCNRFDYLYQLDFCPYNASRQNGYSRVTDSCSNTGWHNPSRLYRTPIHVNNPVGEVINNYQLLVVLNNSNFDYTRANNNGSDILFIDSAGNSLNYWIESWSSDVTLSSRIWVNLTTLPVDGDTIYMYYGDPHAAPNSSGEKTFIFFDDFQKSGSAPDGKVWIVSDDKNVYITDNEVLVIKNGAAIKTKVFSISQPCVIEARVWGLGDHREASMFFGNNNNEGLDPYYTDGYLFSSGNLSTSSRNLALIKDNTQVINSSSTPMPNSYYCRLRCILNNNEIVLVRYFYSNFTVDDTLSGTGTGLNGFFGLCTTQSDTVGYYDWVYVRKFAANTASTVTSLEEFEPTAEIKGTESLNFNWMDISKVKTVKNGGNIEGNNFVCNRGSTDSATFKIMNLTTDEDYSLTFVVGDQQGSIDPDKLVQNMTISINGVEFFPDIDCTNINPIKKIWITGVKPNPSGELTITFDDKDDGSKYYWVVQSLTLEKGKRQIQLTGGR